MRVLMISWEYPPYVVGGVGKHVAELAPAFERLADDSLHVDLVTTRYSGGAEIEAINKSVTVHRIQTLPFTPVDHYNAVVASNGILVSYAQQLAKKERYDIIHNHEWLTGAAGIALKHAWKTPLVTTIHATERGRHQGYLPSDTSRQINQMEWQLGYEAWRLIVCSRYMIQELGGFFGIPANKVGVIPNGVDMNQLHPCSAERAAQLRAEYAPNGERLLFFVGRITHEKGLQVLLAAMPKILQRYPNTRLLAAGKNSEKMWERAHELGIGHAVHFLGYITNEQRDHLYQTVDAAVFPSLYEPFGIVALEAMAQGCNVVASDVGGLSEVVHHTQNGLTIYPNDPDSVVWAVDQLFAGPEAAQRYRAQALHEVQTRYNWDTITCHTVEFYRHVVAERQQTEW
ncbi:MAG: glycosyltransferase family 4 protein [Caldilineaceae bacterium]|nr:glycosyltransferase family 4 protein [Caldilineaceae bacterium]